MTDQTIQLVNAVGGGDLHAELDLQELSESMDTPVNRYDPEYHPSLYIKFDEEGATLLVFRTGKYNIAGAKSISDLLTSNEILLKRLSDLGISTSKAKDSFEIRNLVFSAEFETEFELAELTVGLGMENSEYEPEQFPGLQFRPDGRQGLFLIFRTGKVILTGVDDEDTAHSLFADLEKYLDELGAI